MANELWKQRVQRAQEAAAGRRGVDVSVMLPPRNPSADGSTHQAEKAVVEQVAMMRDSKKLVQDVTPVTCIASGLWQSWHRLSPFLFTALYQHNA